MFQSSPDAVSEDTVNASDTAYAGNLMRISQPRGGLGDANQAPGRRKEEVAERRLLLAVLERAIYDYLLERNSNVVEDAQEWLFAQECDPALRWFSFAFVCEYLNIDAPKMRDRLRSKRRYLHTTSQRLKRTTKGIA